jgi:hypothetical protein
MLYMFQEVPPPIIRSAQLYIQLHILLTSTAASCYRGRAGTLFQLFEPFEVCRACVKIDKSRNVASCGL